LFQSEKGERPFCIFDPAGQIHQNLAAGVGLTTAGASITNREASIIQSINAAFIVLLAGQGHREFEEAGELLARLQASTKWQEYAGFYLNGVSQITREIETVCEEDAGFASRLRSLAHWLSDLENFQDSREFTERIWSVFFPEAAGVWDNEAKRVKQLRDRRTVGVSQLNPDPITDTARQVLFTSNVLLTLPPQSKSIDELPLSAELKSELGSIVQEPQRYWYDHPIQIGVQPESNEVLYGLNGLASALDFERARGDVQEQARLNCVLSVSVTHLGLHSIAKQYLGEVLARAGALEGINAFVFTESDTRRMVTQVLAPAAQRYLNQNDAAALFGFFGVDGEYGRHYSFLKAIAAFWSVFIQPEIKGTFKIDLDQVFPQPELVEYTGASAFDHFKTPLWGAHGVDCLGRPLELGMIAGALVNQSDIHKSLFTPDVAFPDPQAGISPEDHFFFSRLPQALSTEAEMMARYASAQLDGKHTCLQRVHVTGGTNGILVDSLRRYRPFTPSFIGRAEDQAYLLPTFPEPGDRLAYVHAAGLIMRHDKEAFAQEAIQSAHIGKLIGDYERILYFSAYARALAGDVGKVKQLFDPFTGGFISQIPTTVVFLRFALKAASFFAQGQEEQGLGFVKTGIPRIRKALDFIHGHPSPLKQQYENERRGWDLFYDTLEAAEEALDRRDDFALDLRRKAQKILEDCGLHTAAKKDS
jgi:hypothetical protein